MRSRNLWLAYTMGQSGMSGRAMTKLCARRISGCSSDVGSTCTAPGQLLCRGELLWPARKTGLQVKASCRKTVALRQACMPGTLAARAPRWAS